MSPEEQAKVDALADMAEETTKKARKRSRTLTVEDPKDVEQVLDARAQTFASPIEEFDEDTRRKVDQLCAAVDAGQRGALSELIRLLVRHGLSYGETARTLTRLLNREVRYQHVRAVALADALRAQELAANPSAARCRVCGALLTADDSIAAGIGPVCAGKHPD